LATPSNVEPTPTPSTSGGQAPVEPVGRDPDGHMDVPNAPEITGWYSLRARPGERGSAVIAGHSGYRVGAAVFDQLGGLEPGDVVYVEDEEGRTVTFVMRESRLYDWDAYAPEVFRRDDGAYLNLITCTGAWNPVVGTSSKRLIVFCDLRETRPFAERVRSLIE
jgi:LPXTG-site transpeptidase (sortase) family protein